MNETQLMMYSLLLFIAYRLVNPNNERDMRTLKEHRDYFKRTVEALVVDE